MTTRDSDSFDVVVIGGGPGGYAAALYGAAGGLRVALVERDKVGGTCLHRGCVPAKEFLETASVWRTIRKSGDFGISVPGASIDFSQSQERKNAIVDQLFKGLSGLLKGRGVTVFSGTGQLRATRKVDIIDGPDFSATLSGRHVILAPGSVPATLPGLEVDGQLVVTSDHFLDLDHLPASVAIIGGGAIGCEFASLLCDLGTKVHLIEALDNILAGCDQDVVPVVSRSFSKRGIEIHTATSVERCETTRTNNEVRLTLANGQALRVEMVIVSVGRRARTERLVAEGTSVVIDERGFIVTSPYQRTPEENVWAVGDAVAGTPQLAHVGFAQAVVAIKMILGESPVPIDYERVPWAIYSHPEVAFAGLSEAQAKEQGYDVVVKKDPYGGNSRARIIGDTEGMVKIIAVRNPDGSGGQILGVHMVGPWATEQLGQGYLAVNWEACVDEVAEFIQPHPSLSETFGEAMLALTGRGIHVG